jgi:hypothetical protein
MSENRDRIRAELEQIRNANDGQLLPEAIVEFARNRDTALHREFEWNNTKAAHQFRLEQARRVIRLNINVLPTEGGDVTVPMYVSLKSDRYAGGGYRTLEDVMSDEDMRAQLLEQGLEEFQRVRRKYQTLQELTPVFAAIDRVARRTSRQATRA